MAIRRAVTDCPECELPFEGAWEVPEDQEDMEGVPVATQRCPAPLCGAVFSAEFPGWSYGTEAG